MPGTDWGKVLIGAGILSGVGVASYGLWWLLGMESKREEIKQELIREYLLELEDLEAYQAIIAETGREPTEFENKMLDAKIHSMQFKEYVIREYSETWFYELVETIKELGWTTLPILAGIVLFPIAGVVSVMIALWLWRHRPPRPPKWQDPKTGAPAASPEELESMCKDHRATTDPGAIATAQQIFVEQPEWVQAAVAAESRVYGRSQQPWITLSEQDIIMIAYGAAFAWGAWMAGPALGPLAALLLI